VLSDSITACSKCPIDGQHPDFENFFFKKYSINTNTYTHRNTYHKNIYVTPSSTTKKKKSQKIITHPAAAVRLVIEGNEESLRTLTCRRPRRAPTKHGGHLDTGRSASAPRAVPEAATPRALRPAVVPGLTARKKNQQHIDQSLERGRTQTGLNGMLGRRSPHTCQCHNPLLARSHG
jgi:hypothetical protein